MKKKRKGPVTAKELSHALAVAFREPKPKKKSPHEAAIEEKDRAIAILENQVAHVRANLAVQDHLEDIFRIAHPELSEAIRRYATHYHLREEQRNGHSDRLARMDIEGPAAGIAQVVETKAPQQRYVDLRGKKKGR